MLERVTNQRDIISTSTTVDGKPTMDFTPRFMAVARELRERGEHILKSPYMIEFEPEATCQFACPGCSYGKIREIQINDPTRRRLPVTLLRGVIDDVQDLDTRGIFISGGGEPLNYPDINDLIVYAGERINPVSIQTNGLALEKLLDDDNVLQNIQLISVSVYGADEESFQTTTDRSLRSLIAFQASTRRFIDNKPDWIKVNGKILITPGNYHMVPDMIEFCEEVGMESINLREIQNIETGFSTDENKMLTREEREELVFDLEPMRDRPYVNNFLDNVLNAEPIASSRSCYTARMGMVAIIDTDGDVYVGTPEIGTKQLSIGNIHQNRFLDIWRSDRHQEVVSKMVEMQSNRTCLIDNCRHAPSHSGVEKYLEGRSNAPTLEDVLSDPLGGFI